MSADNPLQKTPLYDLHIELGAKMVPFTGYEMPVQYPEGIIKEHLHTRVQAGLFDVSHMGQLTLSGPGVTEALEALLPVDLGALPNNHSTYAVFTNEQGGILDDLIVTRWDDDTFFMVVNAACKEQDINHLRAHLGDAIELNVLSERALVALQGPAAVDVLAELCPDARELVFMTGCHTQVMGEACYVTRSGYTGEDGFEISMPAAAAETITRKLLSNEQVKPVGLGARDALRLEAGLCLYGNDMDTTTSPIEASLIWSISKSRRADGAKAGGFLGADAVLGHIANGVSRKRVGLAVEGRAPIREGAIIQDLNGNDVGVVTSGGFGANVEAPVAMGYVATELAKVGTELQALVRGKPRPVSVAKT
ncbi:MAG: glycine cleavage system aminomethyltransferase GcvT, partial [Porticoccaceae bacterium]|nr:glycine cleavage system aminomethyltransferase GcvT [Porticoccaceae bacterium]